MRKSDHQCQTLDQGEREIEMQASVDSASAIIHEPPESSKSRSYAHLLYIIHNIQAGQSSLCIPLGHTKVMKL